jgi:hypothetical protein
MGYVYAPAVSDDGTFYYWLRPPQDDAGAELHRRDVDGHDVVVGSFATPLGTYGQTFVKDRADGSRIVYLNLDYDIYSLVDQP